MSFTKRGRPAKKEISYDPDSAKEFVKRYYEIQKEMNVLKEDIKDLKDEYKNKINQKLITKVMRLVKTKLDLQKEETSEQTIEEIEEIVKDKINMVI